MAASMLVLSPPLPTPQIPSFSSSFHSSSLPTKTHNCLGIRRRKSRPISSPLRVAAPPTTTTTEDQQQQQQNPDSKSSDIEDTQDDEQDSSSKFSWRDHWYPVSLVEDLDPSLPTPFQLLNRDIVIWFDKSGSQWVALDDKCPHRLAPLSVKIQSTHFSILLLNMKYILYLSFIHKLSIVRFLLAGK